MNRIPSHTVEDAPEASRPLLQTIAQSSPVGNNYMIGIASRFARMSGWTEAQIAALRAGAATGDTEIDALTRVVREAAANSGNVTDGTWKAAEQSGWSDSQLADAFAHLGLTVFTGYFLNYAQTAADV